MGTTFCPSLPRKPKPNVGKDQAGSGPAGRQTGLAKLPITSQTFQVPWEWLRPTRLPSKRSTHVSRSSQLPVLSPSRKGRGTGAC